MAEHSASARSRHRGKIIAAEINAGLKRGESLPERRLKAKTDNLETLEIEEEIETLEGARNPDISSN